MRMNDVLFRAFLLLLANVALAHGQYTVEQVTTGSVNHRAPGINTSGEIVWMQETAQGWQVFSSTRGQLTSPSGNYTEAQYPTIADDGGYVCFRPGSLPCTGSGYLLRYPGESTVEFCSRNVSSGAHRDPIPQSGISSDGTKVIWGYEFYSSPATLQSRKFYVSGTQVSPGTVAYWNNPSVNRNGEYVYDSASLVYSSVRGALAAGVQPAINDSGDVAYVNGSDVTVLRATGTAATVGTGSDPSINAQGIVVFERSVGGYYQIFRAAPSCPVGLLTKQKFPPLGYDDSCLDSELEGALLCFESAVLSNGGTIVEKTAACRTRPYQEHLREIWENAGKLRLVSGINVITESPLQFETTPDTAVCAPVVTELNDEIKSHFPKTFPPDVALDSAHVRGAAVDWTIGGLTESKITEIAANCGLWRPLWPDGKGRYRERWHFQLSTKPPSGRVVVQGHSPINILVTDPIGRKVGFDAATNSTVNDIGSAASYSGPGSTPQVIEILPEQVIPGRYAVSGVGTGPGAYTIDIQIFTEDNSGDVVEKVLATGTATAGQPLATIPSVDCIQSTMFLRLDRVGQNLILLGPPWVTNVVVEQNSNLLTGSWSVFPQPFSPTNGLVLTNVSNGTRFFRLRTQ